MSVVSSPPTAREVWSHVLDAARRDVSESSFAMWFAEVRPVGYDGTVLEIEAPSDYVRDWLSRHYVDMIQRSASAVVGSPVRVRLSSSTPRQRQEAVRPGDPSAPIVVGEAGPTQERARPFLEQYTFDTFVPGPSNRFAHAAAMAVAEAPPSRAYNPLFIYGGVGLGKTHLLYAIANHMMELMPGIRCKYVTSETFVTEFIKAVRERQAGHQFQRRYREVDVLLVDDIQFLAGKEETQTEFFHTFNALHTAGRQIVIASDRPPQELSALDDRLRTRFRMGLCVDVQPPDLETRIAILQLKALRDGIEVPDEVLSQIATRFDQNIRELEGALLRVCAFASLLREPISGEIAERALEDLLPQSGGEIPPQRILDETAAYFELSREDLVSKNRSRPLTIARQIGMYLMRECTGLSLIKIGEWFHRDHTTVLYGIGKVEKLMRERGSTYRQVQDLTRRVRSMPRGS
jgi:chromosomal replication initiator protein